MWKVPPSDEPGGGSAATYCAGLGRRPGCPENEHRPSYSDDVQFGAPGRNRTCGIPLRTGALFRLSYGRLRWESAAADPRTSGTTSASSKAGRDSRRVAIEKSLDKSLPEEYSPRAMNETTKLTISASRCAALLGQSKWQTRLALYYELTGEAPPKEDNPLLEEGRAFERTIFELACKRFGVHGIQRSPLAQELLHGDLSGHPDFCVVDEHGHIAVAEIKNTLFSSVDENEEGGWGEPWTDQVPPAYLIQCTVYGHLLQKTCKPCDAWPAGPAPYVYLFARLRNSITPYKIPVDAALVKTIELEASQMLDRVARGEPPDPQEPSEFRKRWLPDPKKVVACGAEQVAIAKKYSELGKTIRQLEKDREALGTLLLGFVRDGSSLEYEGDRIASFGADREFHEAEFMAHHPEIAAHHMKLDRTSVKKAHSQIYELFMKSPESAADAKRVIRINERALEGIDL